jgi:2-hydroxychromene-2-carboxylate isomerase
VGEHFVYGVKEGGYVETTATVDTVQEHRKATLRAMLRHGDITEPWTTATLAERIGIPEDQLIAYVEDRPGAVNWVDSQIMRYLSVNICNWRGGA